MPLHRLICVLLPALILAACASPAGSGSVITTPVANVPTSAATSLPTVAPAPTQAPAATSAPQPSPTAIPATSAPTLVPQPTAKPPTATQAPQPRPSAQPGAADGELLFLRNGELWAFDSATTQQRKIVAGVRDFVASPDGARIALIRGEGLKTELWIVRRDGSDLVQLTHNDRAEATPAWAVDSAALVLASSTSDKPYMREWAGWSQWCAASEVHLLNLVDMTETALAAGCDPAISPDGKRIAFAAPPRTPEPEFPAPAPLTINSVRLINRQGQNGWDFAKATGAQAPAPNTGRIVYAPAWSPDGKQVAYHRFLGYQALVDLDLSEIAGSFEGKGKPLESGAGWLLPARFAPDGRSLAITENNYSDARGFGGYDNWSVSVIALAGQREIALPSGTIMAVGQRVDQLPRGQSAVWSSDGATLVVELPPGWRADLPNDEPVNAAEQPGELWLWTPGSPPARRLVDGVDFASPLAWLP
jgi:hypothetical protein